MVVSPFVDAGTCFSQPLDHTSILRMLADKFTAGDAVLRRRCGAHAAIHSAAEAFMLAAAAAGCGPRGPAAAASDVRRRPRRPCGARIPPPNAIAYLNAIEAIRRRDPQAMAHKYPAWKDYFLKGR